MIGDALDDDERPGGDWSACGRACAQVHLAFIVLQRDLAQAAGRNGNDDFGTKAGDIGRPDTWKLSRARWVCAPHSASAGTFSSPMLSCSMRVFCWDVPDRFAMRPLRSSGEDTPAAV